MITKMDVSPLNDLGKGAGRVLSVYLDVDQSKAANLNRCFVTAFKARVQEIERTFEEEYEHRDFEGCAGEVRNFLSTYEPHGRGLVIFARSAGPVWTRELNVPVAEQVVWGTKAHVQPFLEAMDEFQSCGIVVLDHVRARIFTVAFGQIQRHAEVLAMHEARHIKTTGTDHLYSQSHFQRRADEHSLEHLKRVGEVLENVARISPFSKLILAGVPEVTSELYRVLPKALRRKIAGFTPLPAGAPEKQILETSMEMGRATERMRESQEVDRLITDAAKGHKAVVGLDATLQALNDQRTREFFYAEGFAAAGGVCEDCHVIFARDDMNCEYCGVPLKPSGDLVEAATVMALAEGAAIEQLRGEAAAKLMAAGGVGAYLRF